jgi:anti-sigma factor (TIGR02949 family)
MDCKQVRELLPAYVDREIGLSDARAFEAHLDTCAACRAERDAQVKLREAVAAQATYFRAPSALGSRIAAALPAAVSTPRHRRRTGSSAWGRWNVGVALASLVAIVWSMSVFMMLPSAQSRLGEELVASHVRSLISERVTDVASSDQHTVKPWFNGKLDYAPPVHDLTTEGFPLVGGRVDYIDHRHVATLVYRRRQHTINLYVWPAAGDKGGVPTRLTQDGYQILGWSRDGMRYWAISDVDAPQLEALREALTQVEARG